MHAHQAGPRPSAHRPAASFDAVWLDLKVAARSLRRAPGFTAIVVLTLALGVGALVGVFGILDQVALRPLPYERPERLVSLYWQRADGVEAGNSVPNFRDIERASTTMDLAYAVFPYVADDIVMSHDGSSEEIDGAWVSSDYFDILGVDAVRGRTFRPGEDEPGSAAVLVLSHSTWQQRFGGDLDVLGSEVRINGRPHEIVGILPAGFESLHHGGATELWLPLPLLPQVVDWRDSWALDAVGRLRPGATLAGAGEELAAVGAEISNTYPDAWSAMRLRARSLEERVLGDLQGALTMLTAAAAFVLLVACSNIAHLLLARVTHRGREISVRRALGAGRLQIARLIICESVLLGLLGGVIGLAIASWGVELMIAAAPGNLPAGVEVGVDARLVVFALVTSVVAGVLFGVLPGLRAAPTQVAAIRTGSPAAPRREGRFRDLLVAAETALVLTLLVAAALSLSSLRNLLQVDSGFDTDRRYVATLTLPRTLEEWTPEVTRTFARIEERLAALPAVRAAGSISHLPLEPDNWGGQLFIEGRPVEPAGEAPVIDWEVASPGYFSAAGIPLLAGRGFETSDDREAPLVTVVNETLAQRFFPDGNALGQRINGNSAEGPWRTIVGIVGDVKQDGLGKTTAPYMYLSAAQITGWPRRELVVWAEAETPSEALLTELQLTIRAVAPDIAIADLRSMDTLVAASVSRPRFQALLLGVFGGIAVGLGVVGIYGVVSYAVSRRTRELGVRLALGADPRHLVARSTMNGLRPVALGIVAGIAGGMAAGELMASTLFAVHPTDPATLAGATLLMAGVAALAAWLPSRRAARVDPMSSLRTD